jgi:hypothetical protein
MANPPKEKPADIELDPAKWGQFEDTLKRALKMPPHPHNAPAPKPKTDPASKGRVHKGRVPRTR